MAKQQTTGTPFGTGTDPLGRYPKGVPYDPALLDTDVGAELLKQGWIEVTEEPMPPTPEPFVPTVDPSGLVRGDRPFDPAEAATIDAANRLAHAERRASRFRRPGR